MVTLSSAASKTVEFLMVVWGTSVTVSGIKSFADSNKQHESFAARIGVIDATVGAMKKTTEGELKELRRGLSNPSDSHVERIMEGGSNVLSRRPDLLAAFHPTIEERIGKLEKKNEETIFTRFWNFLSGKK